MYLQISQDYQKLEIVQVTDFGKFFKSTFILIYSYRVLVIVQIS